MTKSLQLFVLNGKLEYYPILFVLFDLGKGFMITSMKLNDGIKFEGIHLDI